MQVVVINQHPLFSAPVEGVLAEGIRQRYPHQRLIGRFTVASRAAPAPTPDESPGTLPAEQLETARLKKAPG
ncbi:MAG: hypothetical protein J5I93_11830 [Pirellulaceae bacterium]|nr:hypothetical protein [Pirellulaceae bacterium]